RDCAACHGPVGAGDGPAARAFSPAPPDLRAHHAALHTAGDLSWWITHGRRAMPAFGHREPEQRSWLASCLGALGAADAARRRREPRIFFPVVTDGAAEIVTTYSLFAAGPHAEFLVDRQGYLRALEAAPQGTERLLQNVQALNEEKVVVAPPAEHVH